MRQVARVRLRAAVQRKRVIATALFPVAITMLNREKGHGQTLGAAEWQATAQSTVVGHHSPCLGPIMRCMLHARSTPYVAQLLARDHGPWPSYPSPGARA